MPAPSPYAGRRKLGASRKRTDEGKVVQRYLATRNAAQTGREFGIGGTTVRRILDEHGVSVQRAVPDENAVLRSYDRTASIKVTSRLLSVSQARVTEILDRRGVPHGKTGWHRAMDDEWAALDEQRSRAERETAHEEDEWAP